MIGFAGPASCRHTLSRQPLLMTSNASLSYCWESWSCLSNTLLGSALHTHPCSHLLSSKPQESQASFYGCCPCYRRGQWQGSCVPGSLSCWLSLGSSVDQELSFPTISPYIQSLPIHPGWGTNPSKLNFPPPLSLSPRICDNSWLILLQPQTSPELSSQTPLNPITALCRTFPHKGRITKDTLPQEIHTHGFASSWYLAE